MKALVSLALILTVGCTGLAGGDKDNQWCMVGLEDWHTESILAASNEWHNKTDGKVNFSFLSVKDASDCGSLDQIHSVRIDGQYSGLTTWHPTGGNLIEINLNEVANPKDYSAIVMHEFGHYLMDPFFGTSYHSSDANDLMANMSPRNHANGGLFHLSKGDIKAFNLASGFYAEPNACKWQVIECIEACPENSAPTYTQGDSCQAACRGASMACNNPIN